MSPEQTCNAARIRNSGRAVSVPAVALVGMLVLACAGCGPASRLDAASDPLVVTEAGSAPAAAPRSPERVAAIADMRRRAEAGDAMPYPDVFQSEQTARLAAREEPRPVAQSQEIEAELAAIATMRSAALSAAETAELDARVRELQRLASLQEGALRR